MTTPQIPRDVAAASHAAAPTADLVRAIGRPATRPGLPDPGGPPTEDAIAHLASTAREYGIELVGPPLH